MQSADPNGPARHERGSVTRSAGIVSAAVFVSRILGLVREQIFAALFGAGFLSDAFQVGFRVPNTLRDLFAEGALSAAFVKIFTDYIVKKNDEREAWRVASLVMTTFGVVLSAVTLLGILFAPWIVGLIAHDFPPEKAALATLLTRIMFPFILFVSMAAIAMGVLNTKGRFGIPASASTVFNIGSILAGLSLAYLLSGGNWVVNNDSNAIPGAAATRAVIGMAIGTLVGGILQLLIQIPSLLRIGFRFSRQIDFSDPGVRQIMKLMAPALIGTAAVQINVFVDTYFASGITGATSWLAYSFRLVQFPIGLFGVAIGTATLPAVSHHAARGDLSGFRQTIASSISLVFFLAVPSACGLIVLARPIVALIYQHGIFTASDTDAVAWALMGWSFGLVGFAAIKVLSPAFYALDDTRTPMLISLGSILINVLADFYFKKWLMPYGTGHAGLALATSLVSILSFISLILVLRRRIRRIEGWRLISSLFRVGLASAALCAVCLSTYRWLHSLLGGAGFAARLQEALIPIVLGGSTYLLLSFLLKTRELVDLFRLVKSRSARRM